MSASDLPAAWRDRAAELERYAPPAAEAFRSAADELAAALNAAAEEELTLSQAAHESGYSERRLRELIDAGTIPNRGRKGAPRIRRADLPKKPRRSDNATAYDPAADAARLFARGGAR